MRSGLVALLVFALAGCDREPTFDERFQTEAQRLEAAAGNMQEELSAQLNASIAAGRLEGEPDVSLAPNAGEP